MWCGCVPLLEDLSCSRKSCLGGSVSQFGCFWPWRLWMGFQLMPWLLGTLHLEKFALVCWLLLSCCLWSWVISISDFMYSWGGVG